MSFRLCIQIDVQFWHLSKEHMLKLEEQHFWGLQNFFWKKEMQLWRHLIAIWGIMNREAIHNLATYKSAIWGLFLYLWLSIAKLYVTEYRRGICGSLFLSLSFSRSQVVMKKSSNDTFFRVKREIGWKNHNLSEIW